MNFLQYLPSTYEDIMQNGDKIIYKTLKNWTFDYMIHLVDDATHCDDDTIYWFKTTYLHRSGGPARITYVNNLMTYVIWCYNGVLHREDGPASYDLSAQRYTWYTNGYNFRLDGPSYCNFKYNTYEYTYYNYKYRDVIELMRMHNIYYGDINEYMIQQIKEATNKSLLNSDNRTITHSDTMKKNSYFDENIYFADGVWNNTGDEDVDDDINDNEDVDDDINDDDELIIDDGPVDDEVPWYDIYNDYITGDTYYAAIIDSDEGDDIRDEIRRENIDADRAWEIEKWGSRML